MSKLEVSLREIGNYQNWYFSAPDGIYGPFKTKEEAETARDSYEQKDAFIAGWHAALNYRLTLAILMSDGKKNNIIETGWQDYLKSKQPEI